MGVVVVAAGSGTRLGAERPKAFVEVVGTTILERAVAGVLEAAVDELVVVVPEDLVAEATGLVDPLRPEAPLGQVTRTLATYNLISAPVVDEAEHLLGVVTVDDVLDHILPDDWRGAQLAEGVTDASTY